MKYHTIFFHFVYENNSFTIEEKVNSDCIILNIYSFTDYLNNFIYVLFMDLTLKYKFYKYIFVSIHT